MKPVYECPFKVGDLVRVDWETSRMHGETGKVQQVRSEGTYWSVLASSDQFPHLDPIWYGDRALAPLDGCNNIGTAVAPSAVPKGDE